MADGSPSDAHGLVITLEHLPLMYGLRQPVEQSWVAHANYESLDMFATSGSQGSSIIMLSHPTKFRCLQLGRAEISSTPRVSNSISRSRASCESSAPAHALLFYYYTIHHCLSPHSSYKNVDCTEFSTDSIANLPQNSSLSTTPDINRYLTLFALHVRE